MIDVSSHPFGPNEWDVKIGLELNHKEDNSFQEDGHKPVYCPPLSLCSLIAKIYPLPNGLQGVDLLFDELRISSTSYLNLCKPHWFSVKCIPIKASKKERKITFDETGYRLPTAVEATILVMIEWLEGRSISVLCQETVSSRHVVVKIEDAGTEVGLAFKKQYIREEGIECYVVKAI